jgi:hypothetical protein
VTDQTRFWLGHQLAERVWKQRGVTEKKMRAGLLESNYPSELLCFQAVIASFARAAHGMWA